MTDPRGVDVYVSAGSNIEPAVHLRLACEELAHRYGSLQCSTVYRTPAVGFAGDDFLNVVVGFRTDEPPEAVHDFLETVHRRAGRVRLPNRYSPRTLDLDLLLYGDRVDPAAALPHGDIEKYPFVLGPLAEIAPHAVHPVKQRTLAALWADARKPHNRDARTVPMEPVDIGLQALCRGRDR